MPKLNDNKIELMLVTSKRTKHLNNLPATITIENAQIPFKQSVKNFGFTLGCHLTMNAHVSNIARTCYFELRRLASIRRGLVARMSIFDTKGRRFEPQHQYVFSLSKRLYPHCFSRLSCEMSTRWGQPREGCSVL